MISLRILATLLLSLVPLGAQVATGNLTVLVEDSSGAAMAGASVTVTNNDTAIARTGSTNDRGEFLAPFLPAGVYTVGVEHPGFKKNSTSGLQLRVDQSATARVSMQPGEVRETVEVTDVTPLLDAETSSLGQVVENKKILDLPLNGRNAFGLGLLAGNTTPMFGIGSNLPFIAGGGRYTSTEVLLDGVDNNTVVNGGAVGRSGLAYSPSVDAVQEFKVKTSTFAAEFGRAAGAVMNATIKSGSNLLHGSLFEFLRNDKFDANNFITNSAGLSKAKFRQNQFGGSLGGPIVKQKTFFFLDYQGTRQRTAAGTSIGAVPPAALRSGNLTALRTPIFDPLQRRIGPAGTVISTPFPNAQIPPDRINRTSAAIMGQVPLPNFGNSGDLSRNYFQGFPRRFNGDQFDVRVDHQLTAKNSLFGRFSFGNQVRPTPGRFAGFIGGGTNSIDFTRQVAFNDTHIFRPTVVNEFRAGYTRHNGSIIGNAVRGVEFARSAGLALFPFPLLGFPQIQFFFSGQGTGSTQFDPWGGGDSNLNFENRFHVADSLSVTHGKHTFKMGADVRRMRFETLKGTPFHGQYVFGSIFTTSSDAPGSGAPIADYLLGYPSLLQGTQMLDWGRQRETYFGTYFQDDWKVTPRLTLNLGGRYDLFTQPVDARDRGGLFDIASGQFVVPGKNGFSRAIVDGDHNNIAPRMGLAYQWNRKLVIRGGYGIFIGQRDVNQEVTQFSGNNPNTPTFSIPETSATRTVLPPFTLNSPIPAGPSDPSLKDFSASNALARTIRTAAFHDARMPMLQQFNVSIQFEPFASWLFETSYSGARGSDLYSLFVNVNQLPFQAAIDGRNQQRDRPYPHVNGAVIPTYSNASSNYNAFNVKVEKRYSHGMNFLFNYTVQKNLEDKGAGPGAFTQNGGTSITLDAYNLSRERGPAPIDVAQVLVMSYGYELPWGPGRPWLNQGAVSKVLGGWQINGISYLRGGFPTDIRTNRLPPIFNTFNVPDRVSGQPVQVPKGQRGPDNFFNPAAFRVPGTTPSRTGAPIQLYGDSARRVARGPGSINHDFSIFKEAIVRERFRVQYRAEFFNLFNTPTFFLPSSNSPSMTCIGRSPGSACNDNNPQFGKLLDSTTTGRQIQFGLKLVF